MFDSPRLHFQWFQGEPTFFERDRTLADLLSRQSFDVVPEVSPRSTSLTFGIRGEIAAADSLLSASGIDPLGGGISGSLNQGLSQGVPSLQPGVSNPPEQHASLAGAATRLRHVIKNIQIDGPRGTRIIQLRYQRLPVVRFDYGLYPGTHGQPRLHGHPPRILPGKHIPLDPRRFTDPGGFLNR